MPPDPGARPAVKRGSTQRRRRRVTENDGYAAFARRVLRAWARRVAAGDIDAIADMAAAAGELDDAMRQAVAGLRGKGYSWAEIAVRLGVTRQAAQQRWGGSGRDLPSRGCCPLARSADEGHGDAVQVAQVRRQAGHDDGLLPGGAGAGDDRGHRGLAPVHRQVRGVPGGTYRKPPARRQTRPARPGQPWSADFAFRRPRPGWLPPWRRSWYAAAASAQPGGRKPRPARLRRPVCAPASPAASPGDRREALPPPAHTGRRTSCA